VRPPAPIVPGGAAPRVVGLVHETGKSVECLDLLGVLAEREFSFALLQYRVDAAQAVGVGVRQQVEAVQSIIEISQRLAIGPAALRFFSGEDRVVDGFFRLVAAAEVQRQQFRDFVRAAAVSCVRAWRKTYTDPSVWTRS
jgi:hypothetical protein